MRATSQDDYFGLSVSDTGPGIPAEERERIFDEFHQLDTSTTRTKGGTGLGLAISKKIIEMHGGRISVESRSGRSTFDSPFPSVAQRRKIFVRRRILIVEDTRTIADHARPADSAGYELLEATEGPRE